MKVSVYYRTFTIDFKRYFSTHHDGKATKIDTQCVISQVGHPQCTMDGWARLHHKDRYDKVKGKKIALQRALERASKETVIFDKVARATVWAQFMAEFVEQKSTQAESDSNQ